MRAKAKKPILAALATALLTALAGGTTAATAAEPDHCPNAQFRNGPSAQLPGCRAYELVSPADKGANTLLNNHSNGAIAFPSADGEAVKYGVLTPLPGSVSARPNEYAAHRTAGGWKTGALTPADCEPDMSGIVTPFGNFVSGLSRDFSQAIIDSGQHCGEPRDQAGKDVYLRSPDGTLTWVSQNGQVKTDDVDATYTGSSADAGHILFTTAQKLLPAIDGDRLPGPTFSPYRGLYDRSGGKTYEVGVDDDGKLLTVCGTNLAPSATAQPVSDDGRVALFVPAYVASEPDCDYAHGGDQLYARVDNRLTIELSRSQVDPAAAPTGAARFVGATGDGAHVYFSSPDPLTADADAAGGLYEYDLSAVLAGEGEHGTLTFVSPYPVNGAGAAGPFVGMPALSADGSVAYFVAVGQLPAGGDPSGFNLFRLDHGHVTPVASSSYLSGINGSISISADLSKAVYLATPPGASFGQIYLYDADRPSAGVACVSCPPVGVAASDTAALRSVVPFTRPFSLGRQIFVTDGGKVFFGSPDRLSDRDANDVWDVYEYDHGVRTLLSTGTGADDSLLIGAAGPDLRDVFISTNDSLVAADFDNGDQDIYDARVGGGFPQPVAPAPCSGASCYGQAQPPPAPPVAATISFTGSGNEAAKVRSAKRVAVRGYAFGLKAWVPSAGRLAVRGRGVRAVKRVAPHRATYRVRVALTRSARRALRHRHSLRLRLRVTFKPRHGKASSVAVRVTVRQPAERRSGRAAAHRHPVASHGRRAAKGGH